MRTASCRALGFVALLGVLAWPTAAQIPILPQPKDTATNVAQVSDPLGRNTPQETITSFNRAVTQGNVAAAAHYLQLKPAQRANADTLARLLNELMERYLGQSVATINNSREGEKDDGLPPDRERVGPLVIGDRRIDVGLVRVNYPFGGPVWLISSETVAQVPALHSAITATWIERLMPPPLVRRHVFGASLAQWLALAASLAIPLLVLRALSGLFIRVARRRIDDPRRLRQLDRWYSELKGPVVAVLTLLLHVSALRFMGFALTFRLRYGRLGIVVAVAMVAWLVRRLLGLSFDRARRMIPGSAHSGARSLMLLFERLIKAFVLVVAVLAILTIAGVDTKTALAGVGIGGIAIALGAQKTVENLLGGIFLLGDKALAVGDSCIIGSRQGVVEDITLRSVRLRTPEQTLLSIPAGTLSGSNVENLSARGKILIQSRLRLRYGTSADQVREVLAAISRLMAASPKLEQGTARVRLVEFSERAIELEVFAYVLTPDIEQFLLAREELLLAIAAIVESSGAGFAQPTQFVYMEREVDLEPLHEEVRVRRAEMPVDIPARTAPRDVER